MTHTYSTEGPECPYCGCRITPDEGFYHDENRCTELDCPDCDKTFSVEVNNWTSWRCTPKETTTEDSTAK